ncbi:hypothetical protein EHS25_005443 [Saitozyma podzolica]|uniref:Major facilitator superfamily (MFS) profile domain-containing protein n=1 Tax=Saitozyma podzolica TaxID=1890683 RepID=A0A427XY69_9TREE|nr:hypothetical protein EHS25_005443 [Saitozyma podzolica]
MSTSTLGPPAPSRAPDSTSTLEQGSAIDLMSLRQPPLAGVVVSSSEPARPPPAARPAFPDRQQQQQVSSAARQVEATITSDPKPSTSLPLPPHTGHSNHSNGSSHSNRSTHSNHSNHSDPFQPCLAPKPDPSAPSPAHSSLAEIASNVPDSPPRHQSFALNPCLQPDPPVDPLEHKTWAWRIAFVIVSCSTQYLAQGQFGAVIIPLPEIGEWLGTKDAGELSWMAASYGLTIGMFLVASGRLGDLYGPKLLWTTGYVLMIIANLASGFCVSRVPFDVCRGLAGMGAALSLPNAVAILGRTYPPGRTRSLMFAILGALAPAGFWAGGLIAAAFAVSGHVPWIWWFNGCMYSTVADPPQLNPSRSVPLPRPPRAPRRHPDPLPRPLLPPPATQIRYPRHPPSRPLPRPPEFLMEPIRPHRLVRVIRLRHPHPLGVLVRRVLPLGEKDGSKGAHTDRGIGTDEFVGVSELVLGVDELRGVSVLHLRVVSASNPTAR